MLRDPDAVLTEVELLASPPERVHQWLRQRADRDKGPSDWDADLEKALLERNDPLINLGLARYGLQVQTLATLFWTTDEAERKGLRLAVLANREKRGYGEEIPAPLIGGLFAKPDHKVFTGGLNRDEVASLFRNPAVSDHYLIGFLTQADVWHALDADRQVIALASLAKNTRIHTEYEGPMDGGLEYHHGKVFDAAWMLATTLPVTKRWALPLGDIYEKLLPDSFSMEKPLEVAARWTPSEAEDIKQESECLAEGYVLDFALVRQGLARLEVAKLRGDHLKPLLEHPDPAVRSAAYRAGDLTAEQMRAAAEREPKLCFETMTENAFVWRSSDGRSVLHDIAWDDKNDPTNDMIYGNRYRDMRTKVIREHRDWFSDDPDYMLDFEVPPEVDPSVTRPEFTAAVESLESRLNTNEQLIRNLQTMVELIPRKISGLWWGLAALLAVVLLLR